MVGTDDEHALVKAITTEFPHSIHVLCTRHLQENARQQLTDDGVCLNERKIILSKIFGQDGIVGATDNVCFESKCDELQNYCTNLADKFVIYFNRRLKGLIKYKVNEPMREGFISCSWTNNNSESINHMLKQTVNWETKGLPEFVRLTNTLVDGQFKELRSALLGTGEFRLAPSHEHFLVSKLHWIAMTDQQRNQLYKKYRSFAIKVDRIVISSNGQSSVVAPRTDGKKPGQRKRKVNVRTVTLPLKKAKH